MEMLKIDGFDDAIIGRANVWKSNTLVDTMIYSGEKMVRLMEERDGMTEEEALEYIDFNIEGAYVGPATPIIVWEYYE